MTFNHQFYGTTCSLTHANSEYKYPFEDIFKLTARSLDCDTSSMPAHLLICSSAWLPVCMPGSRVCCACLPASARLSACLHVCLCVSVHLPLGVCTFTSASALHVCLCPSASARLPLPSASAPYNAAALRFGVSLCRVLGLSLVCPCSPSRSLSGCLRPPSRSWGLSLVSPVSLSVSGPVSGPVSRFSFSGLRSLVTGLLCLLGLLLSMSLGQWVGRPACRSLCLSVSLSHCLSVSLPLSVRWSIRSVSSACSVLSVCSAWAYPV